MANCSGERFRAIRATPCWSILERIQKQFKLHLQLRKNKTTGLRLASSHVPTGRGTARSLNPYPKALRTHILRLLGPKTIPYKAFGLF